MRTLELEISNPCNERCLHCYRTCESTKKGFLTVMQVKSILQQAVELEVNNVTITGGEALLNPDWKGILKEADTLGLKISLFTNGSLLTATDIDFLKSITNLRIVQLSLYGLDSEIHDKITGLKGSCKKTLAAINLLKERQIGPKSIK